MPDFFEQAKKGEIIDLVHDERFHTLCMREIRRSRSLCFQINMTDPMSEEYRKKLDELFCTSLSDDTMIEPFIQVDYGCQFEIGKNVFIGNNFSASAFGGITIEDNAMIGFGCAIATVNHLQRDLTVVQGKKVVIKKGAWLGARVTIVPGVTVGEGAVVGAGSVVTKDIPDGAVAVGNPARVIKYRT